jgi:archaellum component FlaC
MGKVLPFKRVKPEVKALKEPAVDARSFDDDISAVINDFSLTPSNRHWILENMLMNIDEQLEEYKKELERAESKLEALVKSAETDIASAFNEFESHVQGMTKTVRKLTRASSREKGSSNMIHIAANVPERC